MIALGCRKGPVATAKYFEGEPVEHWLTQMKSPDAKKRKHAADVLGNVGLIDPGAVPALTAALKDQDAKVRLAAVLALSKIGPPAASAGPDLEAAAKDADPEVRRHAATALERVRRS
jgi:HEAT repeat protein